jgi:hypothetical protein
MPSLIHETPVELVRQCPELILDVLRELVGQEVCDLTIPDQVTIRLAPTDMSQVIPIQFLADSVVVAERTGKAVLCIVIEPQGRDARTKEYSWPVYLTAARRLARTSSCSPSAWEPSTSTPTKASSWSSESI